MNDNRSYRTWVLGGLAVIVVAAVVEITLALGRHSQQAMADTPEGTVAAIYRLCQEGQYDQTAQYYADTAKMDAQYRVKLCEAITRGRTIKGWDVVTWKEIDSNAVFLETLSYRDPQTKSDGMPAAWQVVRWHGRWLVEGAM